ncbi:homoserine O-succinyltransferase [Brevundimonas sp.]|uniref:homoserine O-succinyltransferase MetX n=1 Tax=Brevundimonas sp. TaxID=1871086 RepID=UPI003918CA0C
MERRSGDVSTVCHRVRGLAEQDDADDDMAFDTQTLEPLQTSLSRLPKIARGNVAVDLPVEIPTDFRLQSGERLAQRRITGRLHGREGAPLVVVAGGISAGRFVHRTETNGLGWWSGAVSIRGPIDLNRFQVLAFDYAPESASGARPVTITTHDQARLLALILDAIGDPIVSAFVGCSYGGMIALAFAELFPERVEQLVVVSAAHRAHPQATAWRGIQRRILQLAEAAGRPEDGVALARELAMTTYRTAEEFADRFETVAPSRVGGSYPVCDYLTARGRAYRTHTTPSRWLSLSDSIDRHQVTPEAIVTPVTLVGFASDRLVPIEDIRELAARLPTLFRFVEAPSLFGHDAFLKEDEAVGAILRAALKEITQ